MIITDEIIEQGKSRNGGWSDKQWRLLGIINHYKIKGWKKRLIGKTFSEETIKKFLELKDKHIKSGTKKKKNHKRNRSGYILVNKPLSWKEQYKHPNWQRKRLEILKRDNFTCRMCLNKDDQLHVHHLKYDKTKFIWEIHEMYLVTLCHSCHEKEHGRQF